MFGSVSDAKKSAEGLTNARPLLALLAADPSLRGIMKTLSLAADGVRQGRIKLEQLAWPLSLANQTLTDLLSGKRVFFSWQELLEGHTLPESERRHFIEAGTGAELRKYRGAAAAPGSRGRVQDLLHHGLASWKDRAAAVDSDAGRRI
jgi:uncharacterized protein